MKIFTGIDLGSTTTKAVLLDEQGHVLGRGITNSRSNYDLAANIAQTEARTGARFELLGRALAEGVKNESQNGFIDSLKVAFCRQQELGQLDLLKAVCVNECESPRVKAIATELREKVSQIVDKMLEEHQEPHRSLSLRKKKTQVTSDFFRDRASSRYSRWAEEQAGGHVGFDDLMSIFDKAIIQVENTNLSDNFETMIMSSLARVSDSYESTQLQRYRAAVEAACAVPLDDAGVIGTGYGRQRLPFPKDSIRSEILCHGLGAHAQFPDTRTVLDIGGQDTKAIQVDGAGIVTSFQMNDRCAAGCGRYLGYIADEMSMGVHELGPIAMKSERRVKISSTCTVFAGAELRDRLSNGQKQEDILAGLHRAIVLRAMSLLARSGGIHDEFTFTGGVANNPAAVRALQQLTKENYGKRTLNISPKSIYTGALGAALFCRRAGEERRAA